MAVQDVTNLAERNRKRKAQSTIGTAPATPTMPTETGQTGFGGKNTMISGAGNAASGLIKTAMGFGGAQTPEPATEPAQRRQPTTNVSKIAANMMKKDNPLMQQAATEGMQYANARGMLNSSMAANAATDAALKQVVPMASQVSEQRYGLQRDKLASDLRMREAEQGFGFEKALNEQGFDIAAKLKNMDFSQEIVMSDKEFDQAMKMSDKEFEQATGMSKLEFQQDYAMQERRIGTEKFLAKLDANTRTELMQMESKMRKQLANLEIGADQKSQMSSMITSMHEQYQKSMASILANPNLPADERANLLKSAGALLQLQTNLVEGVYGMEFDWLNSSFDPNTGTKTKKKKKADEETDTGTEEKPTVGTPTPGDSNAGP